MTPDGISGQQATATWSGLGRTQAFRSPSQHHLSGRLLLSPEAPPLVGSERHSGMGFSLPLLCQGFCCQASKWPRGNGACDLGLRPGLVVVFRATLPRPHRDWWQSWDQCPGQVSPGPGLCPHQQAGAWLGLDRQLPHQLCTWEAPAGMLNHFLSSAQHRQILTATHCQARCSVKANLCVDLLVSFLPSPYQ